MKIVSLLLPFIMIAGGCNYLTPHNGTSYVRDTIARLPTGDEIAAQGIVTYRHAAAETSEPTLIWLRLSPTQPPTQTNGARFLPAKTLVTKGDLHLWLNDSNATRGTSAIRTSPDGDRAWLVKEGRTIASFDYAESVAILGPEGQPSWATSSH